MLCKFQKNLMKTVTVLWLFLLGSFFAVAQVNSQPSGQEKRVSTTNPNDQLLVAPVNPVKIDPAKEADIRQLLNVMGAGAVGVQAMDNMEKNIRPLMANSLPPGEYRDKLVDLFFIKFHSKRNPKMLTDIAVPVYAKYYSDDEIKGLIKFYSTPLGQKLVTVLPSLTSELYKAGGDLGEDLGRQSMLEVLAEHPDLAKAMEQAGKAARAQAPPK